jgi:hypothetical protein
LTEGKINSKIVLMEGRKMYKPLKIVKVETGYQLYVNNIPMVSTSKGVDFNRIAAGLTVKGFKKGYAPPKETSPATFPTAESVATMAHTIGYYVLKLGDFTFAYTALVGVPGDPEVWWNNA